MIEILQRICRGEGREGDIELLEDLAQKIKDTALCASGPNRAQSNTEHHPLLPA